MANYFEVLKNLFFSHGFTGVLTQEDLEAIYAPKNRRIENGK